MTQAMAAGILSESTKTGCDEPPRSDFKVVQLFGDEGRVGCLFGVEYCGSTAFCEVKVLGLEFVPGGLKAEDDDMLIFLLSNMLLLRSGAWFIG